MKSKGTLVTRNDGNFGSPPLRPKRPPMPKPEPMPLSLSKREERVEDMSLLTGVWAEEEAATEWRPSFVGALSDDTAGWMGCCKEEKYYYNFMVQTICNKVSWEYCSYAINKITYVVCCCGYYWVWRLENCIWKTPINPWSSLSGFTKLHKDNYNSINVIKWIKLFKYELYMYVPLTHVKMEIVYFYR